MKTLKNDEDVFLAFPISRSLTTEECAQFCDSLTASELEVLSVWITAALQERDGKKKRGRR
jgi:hypothetical protein